MTQLRRLSSLSRATDHGTCAAPDDRRDRPAGRASPSRARARRAGAPGRRRAAGSPTASTWRKNACARAASSSAAEGARVRRGRGDERVREAREQREHRRRRPCRARIEATMRADRRQPRGDVAERLRSVGAVPDLAVATLEPPGQRHNGRRGDRAGRGTPPQPPPPALRSRRSRRPRARAVSPGQPFPLAPRRARRSHRAARPRASRPAIASRVRAEHLGVLECDIRQHLHRRAEDVRRVVASAEAGLDGGDVHAALRRTRRGRQRSAPRTGSRRAASAARPDAVDRRLEVRLRTRRRGCAPTSP